MARRIDCQSRYSVGGLHLIPWLNTVAIEDELGQNSLIQMLADKDVPISVPVKYFCFHDRTLHVDSPLQGSGRTEPERLWSTGIDSHRGE